MRARVLLVLFSIAAGITAPPAGACSCGGNRKPFCEQLPASSESATTAVFLGTVESAYPTKEQQREMMEAFFRSGGKRWPADDPEGLVKYWGDHITAAEAEAIRRNDKAAGQFRYNRRLIRLRVDESYVGPAGSAIELLAGTGECCDCSPPFRTGEQYLVVASRGEYRWSTSICSGTAGAKWAQLDIAALRAWKRGQPAGPAIRGSVIDATRRTGVRPGEARGAEGLRVRLNGAGVEREARTDSDGLFAFEGLARAVYQVELDEPGWRAEYDWNPLSQKIDLAARACASPYFTVKQTQSAIRGRLIGGPGVALQGHAVEVVPVGAAAPAGNRVARTNAKGEFTLGEIDPGEYWIGLNVTARPVSGKSPSRNRAIHSPYPATYYPGVAGRETAQVFRIERGQTVELADWTFPAPLKEIEFKGRVLSKDGQPVGGARVVLAQPGLVTGYLQRAKPTEADGRFSVWGIEGIEYRLAAVAVAGNGFASKNGLPVRTEPMEVTLDESGESLPPLFSFDFDLRNERR